MKAEPAQKKAVPVKKKTEPKRAVSTRRKAKPRASLAEIPEILLQVHPKLAQQWDRRRNFDYVDGNECWWRCKEGHVWLASMHERINRNLGCPSCAFEVIDGSYARGSTGFLVDESGLVATTNHVVSNPELPYFVRLNVKKMPARLMARDVGNDVAVLKLDGSVKGTHPLELDLDAYKNFSVDRYARFRTSEIKIDRPAFLIGFPDGAENAVMTTGLAELLFLSRKLSQNAHIFAGEKWEFFGSAKVLHRVRSFGGSSGGPLLFENGLVAGVHTHGAYGFDIARATSVHHLARLLDEVRLRPMVSGFGDYTTPVMVRTTDNAKQVIR